MRERLIAISSALTIALSLATGLPRLLGTPGGRGQNIGALCCPSSEQFLTTRNLLPWMACMQQTQEQFVALAPDSNLINLLRPPMREVLSN